MCTRRPVVSWLQVRTTRIGPRSWRSPRNVTWPTLREILREIAGIDSMPPTTAEVESSARFVIGQRIDAPGEPGAGGRTRSKRIVRSGRRGRLRFRSSRVLATTPAAGSVGSSIGILRRRISPWLSRPTRLPWASKWRRCGAPSWLETEIASSLRGEAKDGRRHVGGVCRRPKIQP